MGDPTLSYLVLGLAVVFEGTVWVIALREFKRVKTHASWWEEIRTSKDPIAFTVLFEDTAALAGLIVALAGISLSHALEMPVLDGIASILIGLILCGVASLLVVESKGLLLGESVYPSVRKSIHEIAENDADVLRIVRMTSMHVGPDDVLVNLEVQFRAGLTVDELYNAAQRFEQAITREHDTVKHLNIEMSTL